MCKVLYFSQLTILVLLLLFGCCFSAGNMIYTRTQEEAAAGLLEMLEAKIVGLFLKDTTFLLSDKPTLADFRLAPILLFARVAIKLPQRLEAYLDEMEKVPGYKEAVEYGGHGPKPFTDDKKRT
jgi:glutathione S-transferase